MRSSKVMSWSTLAVLITCCYCCVAEEVSYVIDSFETLVQPIVSGAVENGTLVNETAVDGNETFTPYVGDGYLQTTERMTTSLLRDPYAAQHNCYGAHRISLWYRWKVDNNHSDVTNMTLELYDSSPCHHVNFTNASECLQLFTSAPVPLLKNNDWRELNYVFDQFYPLGNRNKATPINPVFLHGWSILLDGTTNETGDDVFEFDHLACYGGDDLLRGAYMVETPNVGYVPDTSNNWGWVSFESEVGRNQTALAMDGNGLLQVNYTVQKTANWGGFNSFGYTPPIPGYYNLSKAKSISFDYSVDQAAYPKGVVHLRLILVEWFGSGDMKATEKFYSFHYILDEITDGVQTITLPLEGGPTMDSKFRFTGWSGDVSNKMFDPSRLREYIWELSGLYGLDHNDTVVGSVSFGNMRLSFEEFVVEDFETCVSEPTLTFSVPVGKHFPDASKAECCALCDKDSECLFSMQSNLNTCELLSTTTPEHGSYLRLSHTGDVDKSVGATLSWKSSREATGDFCLVCRCDKKAALIDCRGKNLTTTPQYFDENWLPRELDLRANPNLAIFGTGAFSPVASSLTTIHFPANIRYLSEQALQQVVGLDSVTFENDNTDLLNAALGAKTFGDVCCAPGSNISLAEGQLLEFCDFQGANDIGTDTLYLGFKEFVNVFIIGEFTTSAKDQFMSQAADSPEMCAEYCKLNPSCMYFNYDGRHTNAEAKCIHLSQARDILDACCNDGDYADPVLKTPGLVAGVAPRARSQYSGNYEEKAKKVIISPIVIQANAENGYSASYEVKLGTNPWRGAVWVEPLILSRDDLQVSFSPKRVTLFDNVTSFVVKVSLRNVETLGAEAREVIISNNITACDQAFSLVFIDEEDLLFRFTVTPEGTNIEVMIGLVTVAMAVLLVALAAFIRLRREDSSWALQLEDLAFASPPIVLGRGTFGVVLLAEWRGTDVAVKRVLPALTVQPNAQDDATGAAEEHKSLSRQIASPSFFSRGAASGQLVPLSQNGKSLLTKKKNIAQMRADFVREMRCLSKLRHVNIITGAVVSNSDPLLIMEFMNHGSLYDIIHNESMPLDGDLILPILRDIAQGMRFLHVNDPPIIHGDLKAANCLVDSHFRAKVGDFGFSQKKSLGATGTPYWMSPGLLSGEERNSTESDVYSFGVVLFELYSRSDPYHGENFEQVLREVCDPLINKRPKTPNATPPMIASLMTECYSRDRADRPSFEELDKRLRRIDADHVEPGESRFATRHQKSARSELLLHKVFPKHVADALRDGRSVEPDRRDHACVFFSDIVGFTTISSKLPPQKVTDMLDRLYQKMDNLADAHDIFKIDVIGDAYMCATNLVKDQADHTKRIAEFSIAAIAAAAETLVDEENLSLGCIQIRCGFHVGPVIAYSVFGDAVNTSARMESTSEPGKIQCSETAAILLAKQALEIPLASRGLIQVKGKGEMVTYFVGIEGERPKGTPERIEQPPTLLEEPRPRRLVPSLSLRFPSQKGQFMTRSNSSDKVNVLSV